VCFPQRACRRVDVYSAFVIVVFTGIELNLCDLARHEVLVLSGRAPPRLDVDEYRVFQRPTSNQRQRHRADVFTHAVLWLRELDERPMEEEPTPEVVVAE